MSTQRDILRPIEIHDLSRSSSHFNEENAELRPIGDAPRTDRSPEVLAEALSWSTSQLSRWSRSAAKRCLDCFCVLTALPLLVPAFLVIALAVRLTSRGPVFFVQERMGRHGRRFTIYKFRTMFAAADNVLQPVTTAKDHRFTLIGPFLRRWKLDELPQVLNVLLGHMSLVGPRPKVPEHMTFDLPCRPGITGAATIAFAREEAALEKVPAHYLKTYYHSVVLPAKRRLDSEYMARATFLSDLKLIVDSIFRRWDTAMMDALLNAEASKVESQSKSTLHVGGRTIVVPFPRPVKSLQFSNAQLAENIQANKEEKMSADEGIQVVVES